VTWYPKGNVIICRWPFVQQPLSESQLATFIAGGGLPATVTTTDPAVVLFDWIDSSGVKRTLTGVDNPVDGVTIIKDAPGQYHAAVPVPDSAAAGDWKYRGYGQDGSGNPIAASGWMSFEAT
jgi:hypothetical protein